MPIASTCEAATEPLASADSIALKGKNSYAHGRNPPYWRPIPGATDGLWLRAGVLRRLAAVNARLRPAGLAVFLHDAWRPDAVQRYFHDVWMPAEVRRRQPTLDPAAVQAEVERYWAAPTDDPAAPAPHATGGAVDLTLVFADDGQPLWMGSLFDDVTDIAHTDRFEAAPDHALSYSDTEARANRRLLFWAMTEEGFVNLPDEWWHYSYGDQMWARFSGAPAALYPAAPPPDGGV